MTGVSGDNGHERTGASDTGIEGARDAAFASLLHSYYRAWFRYHPEAAVDALVSMVLEDPEWEIRVQAAAALGKIDREDVVPALQEAANDPNEFVRAAVASALRADGP